MVTVVDFSRSSSHIFASLPIGSPSARPLIGSRYLTSHYYKIEDERQSESALVLFARDSITHERIVIKMLREYKDTRYSLETRDERQHCQLEALQRNRMFTSDVYIGLAGIRNFDLARKSIVIDEIISNPTEEMLDPHIEYALVMHELPEKWRLDYLLLNKKGVSPWSYSYVQRLTKRVVHMHENLPAISISGDDGIQWGGCEQIQKKLIHNFTFLDLALTMGKNDQYGSYNHWESILSSQNDALLQILPKSQHQWCFDQPIYKSYNRLEDILKSLKDTLLHVLLQSQYQWCFDQRIQKQSIKRCHGDLKAPNIWIAPYTYCRNREPWKCIWILDAIDFNPTYSNIDVLSDFAMLVIDIYARTKNPSFAELMVKDYLLLTNQEDEISRSVLAYYLVEKAIVGAVVNIIYDSLPDLGWAFLEAAEMYVKQYLTERVDTQLIPAVSPLSLASGKPQVVSWLL